MIRVLKSGPRYRMHYYCLPCFLIHLHVGPATLVPNLIVRNARQERMGEGLRRAWSWSSQLHQLRYIPVAPELQCFDAMFWISHSVFSASASAHAKSCWCFSSCQKIPPFFNFSRVNVRLCSHQSSEKHLKIENKNWICHKSTKL